MWEYAGVVRNRAGLEKLQQQIPDWETSAGTGIDRQSIETSNLLTVGVLITRSALAREESRGAHFRSDFPRHNDTAFLKHSIVHRDQIRFE
jgi:L-aspartate oxidase